jgi:hypothetical protein
MLTGEEDPVVKPEAAKPVLGEEWKTMGQIADP